MGNLLEETEKFFDMPEHPSLARGTSNLLYRSHSFTGKTRNAPISDTPHPPPPDGAKGSILAEEKITNYARTFDTDLQYGSKCVSLFKNGSQCVQNGSKWVKNGCKVGQKGQGRVTTGTGKDE